MLSEENPNHNGLNTSGQSSRMQQLKSITAAVWAILLASQSGSMAAGASAIKSFEGENKQGDVTAPLSGKQNFLSNPQKISVHSG